jgi:hypothetical protein
MRKRMLLAFGLLIGLGLVALVVWRLQPPRSGVTEANFRRLHAGMSEAQVEAILGPTEVPVMCNTGDMTYAWQGEHCSACIAFFASGSCDGTLRTDDGRVMTIPPEPAPFLDQLRRLLAW